MGYFGLEWVCWVRICQHRHDAQKHLLNGQGRRPRGLQDVDANLSTRVDIRVVHFRLESDLRWLERVVLREVDGEEKDSSVVGRVLRAHHRGGPPEDISFFLWSGGAVRGWIAAHVDHLFLDSLLCHSACVYCDYLFLSL